MHQFKLRLAIFSLVALSGCSVKFTYEKLDWFLPWYLDDFVSINAQQEDLLDQQIDAFLQWHKQDQLPVYARFFGCIAMVADNGLTSGEVDSIYKEMRSLVDDLLIEIAQPLSELAQVLSEDQVDELFENLADRNDAFRERAIEADEEDQRKRRAERMIKLVKRWTYDLRDSQIERITQWSNSYHLQGQAMLGARHDWQQRLREIMHTRQDIHQTQTRLQQLFINRIRPADSLEQLKYEHNVFLLKELIVDLDESLSSYQRNRVENRLRDYQADFLELAGISIKATDSGQDCGFNLQTPH